MDRDGNALNGNEEFNRYWRYVFYIFHIIIIFYFKSIYIQYLIISLNLKFLGEM